MSKKNKNPFDVLINHKVIRYNESEKKYELIAHYNKGTKDFFDYLKVNKNVKKRILRIL